MGKAKIVSGGEDGRYVIALDYGKEARDKRVTALNRLLTELEPKLDEAEGKLTEAQDKQQAKMGAVNDATNDYIEATQEAAAANQSLLLAGQQLQAIASSSISTPAEIQAAQQAVKNAEAAQTQAQGKVTDAQKAQAEAAKALQDAKGETAKAQVAVDLLKDEKTALTKEKAYLAGLDLEDTKEAWCADLTEDAQGEVATIEIPGESALILIKPSAPPHEAGDGLLSAREMQSPEQVFWNAAVLPGWQKWKPTYRRGVITALYEEDDTADVALTDDKSSAQNLGINQAPTLSKVPIVYMTCNAAAFEVGDDCVVMFDGMDWKNPKVVGFVDHPKSCSFSGIAIVFSDLLKQSLPEHVDSNGEDIVYRLVPKAAPGTRNATGEWTVKKLPKWARGGKAVNTDSTGKIYFTGVGGRDEYGYPQPYSEYHGSVNETAYAVEDRYDLSVYRNGVNVGSSRDDEAPLPFVLEWENGRKYAAQLVPRYTWDGATAMFELLVGPLNTVPGQMVGPIVATVDIEPGTTIPYYMISIHPTGRRARALSFKDGVVCKLDFDISPTSLTCSKSGCMSNAAIITETGQLENTIAYDDTWSYTRTTKGAHYRYGFDPKGEDVYVQRGSSSPYTSSGQKSLSSYDTSRHLGDNLWEVTEITSYAYSGQVSEPPYGNFEFIQFLGGSGYSTITRTRNAFLEYRLVYEIDYFSGYARGISSIGYGREVITQISKGNINDIYFDRYNGFVIAEIYGKEKYIYTFEAINTLTFISTPENNSFTVEPRTIIVKHRVAGVVMRLSLPPNSTNKFVAYSASDPLTGSLVVNLQQMRWSYHDDRHCLASWIFLVDNIGVKTIHDIMPELPPDVCVKENRLLFSV